MRQKACHVYSLTAVMSLYLLTTIGCAGKSPESRHYILNPMESAGITATGSEKNPQIKIGVGPIILPSYLKRPQIMVRMNANQVKLLDFDRWAESLDSNMAAVIAENLALLLDTKYVFTYPWKKRQAVDFQITVTVYRFDATPGEHAELAADWAVLSNEDKSFLIKETTRLKKELPSDSPAGMVKTLNDLLSDFSQELADAVKSIAETKTGCSRIHHKCNAGSGQSNPGCGC